MTLKVIIVEDEELVRNEILLTTPWDDFSCEVIGTAENGEAGRELITCLNPDIVITDIRMPGMNGIEMLEKTAPPAALILSGYSDFSYAKDAIKLGVKDYILKPVDDEEFYAALKKVSRTLLGKREASRQEDILPGISFNEYEAPPRGDKQDYYVDKAMEYMKENFPRDISLRDVAEYIGITESYLSRLFKSKTSYSFLDYLKYYRIKKALVLLKDRSRRINEIAREAGFHDMSYFGTVFKKFVGLSPRQYQNGKAGEK